MANKLREGAGSLALAVAENARHRDFEIIVQNRQRYAAEKGKCRDVPVKKSFRRLRRIGLDEAGVRMRQVEHMQLHPYAALLMTESGEKRTIAATIPTPMIYLIGSLKNARIFTR